MDFTYSCLEDLLTTLQQKGYHFTTSNNFNPKTIFLRHDVEANFNNALKFAQLQNQLNIQGTFYFRIQEKHFKPSIVKQISNLGHSIGYHYDDLSHCHGNYEQAIQRFEQNLTTLREIAPVTTINMEGAPRSKYDNRDLWKKYNYKDFGIVFEPYFDVNFNEVAYFTDTGRRWDGKFCVRDKPFAEQGKSKKAKGKNSRYPSLVSRLSSPKLKSTPNIINSILNDTFPSKAMLTFHPQRWHDKPLLWLKELIWQNVKNIGKGILMNYRR